MVSIPLVIGIAALLLAPKLAAGQWQEIVTLPTRTNVTQSYFLTSKPNHLQAVALLFAGAGGDIQLRRENDKPKFSGGNFLMRSHREFIARGVLAAIIDAPSDQKGGLGMSDEYRLGEQHFTDLSAVVVDLKKKLPGLPLFLVGTSRGTISAAALGVRLGAQVDGIVLTATMFRQTGRRSQNPGQGLSKFDFATIKRPLLLVHHVDDQCDVTPYGDAANLSEKYPLISVVGRSWPQSGPCDAYSQHGFIGREAETVEQIVNWMLKKPVTFEIK